MTKKIGVVAGSFDPITDGHVWLIDQALNVFDQVIVVVGTNPAKKPMFDYNERASMIMDSLSHVIERDERVEVAELPGSSMLVTFVQNIGGTHIVRGIRNESDFTYEFQLCDINRSIDPTIESMFFLTPPEMAKISSSTIKSLIGLDGWEDIVTRYVSTAVVEALKGKIR